MKAWLLNMAFSLLARIETGSAILWSNDNIVSAEFITISSPEERGIGVGACEMAVLAWCEVYSYWLVY
jgi:hypothetical protein